MKTFEELKEELLTRAKNAGACQSGYAMGLRSNTKADLLKANGGSLRQCNGGSLRQCNGGSLRQCNGESL